MTSRGGGEEVGECGRSWRAFVFMASLHVGVPAAFWQQPAHQYSKPAPWEVQHLWSSLVGCLGFFGGDDIA